MAPKRYNFAGIIGDCRWFGRKSLGTLAQLQEEMKGCKACSLCRSRVKSVPGEGSESAKVMFIGEAPGFHENQHGRPFVGAAGQFLDQLLASIGLDRSQVFIANVVMSPAR